MEGEKEERCGVEGGEAAIRIYFMRKEYISNKREILFFVCGYIAYIYVCPSRVSWAWRGQTRMLYPLEVGLQILVSSIWVLGIESG